MQERLAAVLLSLMLFLFSVLAGCLLTHKVMQETDPILLLSHGVLTASLLIIGVGNWCSKPVLLGVLIGLCLVCLFLKAPKPQLEPLSKGEMAVLALSGGLVVFYTVYHQFRFLDTDNWLHEPLIGSLMKGVFPPMHPFIPNLEFHYHYGRDFLIAIMAPPLSDPLGTVWIMNPILQLAGFVGLYASIRGLTGSVKQGLLGALMAYFGLCVGARVGLINTFDAYNGVASAQLFLLFHILLRMLDHKRPLQWLMAAFLLGSYQLVYETFWAILFIAGLVTAIRFVRSRWGWAALVVTAVLALGLAAVEGGIFADMVGRGNKVEVSEREALRKVSVKAGFPKEQFLQIPVTAAPYQRISAAYESGLFRSFKPKRLDTGYVFIFAPQFLYAFWLPVLLAPLVGWAVRRHRVGFTFWVFGATSYLLPGVVGFGERLDLEYFRWEFSAAIGFSVAFGIALGMGFEQLTKPGTASRGEDGWKVHIRSPRELGKWFLCLALLIASLAPAQKFLNDAIIDIQRDGLPVTTPGNWRVQEKDLGIEPADLLAMEWLAPKIGPEQQTLSNLGGESALGLWPDIVLAGKTGTHLAGRMRPEAGLAEYAYPNYHRDGAAKAFTLTGDIGLLQALAIPWYYADLDRLNEAALASLTALEGKSPLFEVEGARRQVFPIPSASPVPAELEVELDFAPPLPLRTSEAYGGTLKVKNSGSESGRPQLTCAFLRQQGGEWVTDQDSLYKWQLAELGAGVQREIPFAVVTPFVDGDYQFVVRQDKEELLRVPVTVEYWRRLASVKARLDLPDNFSAKSFEQFRVGLSSDLAVQSKVVLFTRLKRQGGEYVWELDQIPQTVELDLTPGEEQMLFLTLLAPAGDYTLELFLKDPDSHLNQKLAERGVHVVAPTDTVSH